MNSRVAALSIFVTFTFASLPAYAQGSGMPARLAALEARVAKLESGQVDAADLVGTYTFYVFGTYLKGGSPAEITAEMTVGSITLNADGTGSATGKDSGYNLTQDSPWSRMFFESLFSDNFTWSVVDGTLIIPGAFEASVGAGGRVLIAGGTALKGDGWNNLGLLVRRPNP